MTLDPTLPCGCILNPWENVFKLEVCQEMWFYSEKLQDSEMVMRGIDKAKAAVCVPCEWFRMECLRQGDNGVSQVDLTILWDSWCHFSQMLTSPCHVINTLPAIDHKETAVQWILSGAGIWNFLPKGSSGHRHPWLSWQEWHLNTVAWCWIMRALTLVPWQLLNTDGRWALKLQADMSRCPGANWSFSF